jgi:hypothetical protein
MGEIQDDLREGHELIANAYASVGVAGTAHVRPEDCDSLEAFQAAFAAADEWQTLGLIEVIEEAGEAPLIPAIRFRRLK